MRHADSFRDLVVYQTARQVSRQFFELETQHWVDTALDCGYISPSDRDALIAELESIGRMLQSMMASGERKKRPEEIVIRNRPPGSGKIGSRLRATITVDD